MMKNEDKLDKLKEIAKDEILELNKLNMRLNKERDRRGERDEFQRDYTRIVYSSSFRRLQGKMQLLGVQTEKFFRNRLTHSLEVSQIARAIAENLGYKNTYVVETVALAHDMGNPPFGHYGEKILDKLCKGVGGFEGNAQTLRVLMRIEKKNPESRGLNLTLRTLLGVTKYYKTRSIDSNKFIYDEDFQELKKNIDKYDIKVRTLDVQIMDLADEIAYGAHDLEDGLSLRLFTIDELIYEYRTKVKNDDDVGYKKFIELVKKARDVAGQASNLKSSEEYAFLLRKELLGNIVNTLINDIEFCKVEEEKRKKTGTLRDEELDFQTFGSMAKTLKEITFNCINRSDMIQIYEKRGETIIRSLFELYMDDNFNKRNGLLPPEYRTELEKEKPRLVADYIGGMMESYAIATYRKYFGEQALDKIYQAYNELNYRP
ncbi:dNTP triphosphohydrolase [Wukongibacter baidiensis]|uniref:deoxyguanosinetriphosphate triphosphohydrolase family protein n=1 Tax=Wukongibacter baidiensis TaxID=1723361 RepID=UPI003D7FB607